MQELISIDSAGTHSYHVGQAPDQRAIETAAQFDVQIAQLRARKVTAQDFHNFNLIIAMDHSNLTNLEAIRPGGATAELKLMMSYHPENHASGRPDEVPDPYYGGHDGFVLMFELLEEATAGLLEDLEAHFNREA